MAVNSYWTPQIGTTWQWQLDGNFNNAVKATVFDIDASDSQGGTSGAKFITSIKSGNPERKVICYVNVGSLETDGSRSDQKQFKSSDIGGVYPGWPNEKFVDIRSADVRSIMKARFQKMKDVGCDAIEPDNMALNYAGKDGFTPPISDQDSVDYINWLTGTVHDLNLAVASKNGGLFYATHPELVSKFDFAVVEECAASGNCNLYDVFVKAGKPVFAADYKDKGKDGGCKPITGTVAEACAVLNSHNFEGIIKSCGLGATVVQCRGPNANIEQGKGSSGSSDSGNGSSGGISFGVSVAVYVFAAFLAL